MNYRMHGTTIKTVTVEVYFVLLPQIRTDRHVFKKV